MLSGDSKRERRSGLLFFFFCQVGMSRKLNEAVSGLCTLLMGGLV